MTDLEKQAHDEMKVGVDAVLRGRVEKFETTLVPPSAIIEYIESHGGKKHTLFETNGWDWDYWIYRIHVEHGGKDYTVAGSGYYGGVSIERGWEE